MVETIEGRCLHYFNLRPSDFLRRFEETQCRNVETLVKKLPFFFFFLRNRLSGSVSESVINQKHLNERLEKYLSEVLLCKHEDQGLGPKNPCRNLGVAACTYNNII